MSANVHDIYTMFPLLLEERLKYTRKTSNNELAPFSLAISRVFAYCPRDEYIQSILDEKIDNILSDCEIYFQMEKSKSIDAMMELSNYASIYVNVNEQMYNRICDLILSIRRSYPTTFTE